MKKLIPAAGMLMVSAMMLASSTYAWFSMNKEVSVTSMSIAAKSADPIIEISANGTNFYNNLVSTGEGPNWTLPTATDVKLRLITPTAISNAGAVSWGWASSSNHANAEVNNATTAKTLVGQTTPAKTESDRAQYLGIEGEDLYVLTQKLTIRNVSVDVAASNLKISQVNINKGSNTIGNAVRVLFVTADGKYALYEPAASGTAATLVSDHQWLDPASGDAPATDMTAASGLPIISATLAAKGTGETAAAGSSTDVDVYVFFDGTDTDAYTDLATDLSAVTVDFTFAID
jgi:hypothetical protein